MSERVECVVVGAGVVGLAVARALALDGREVIVLERETSIGTGTSSRNSEVIHAGIHYPPGSLKARSCVAGKQALYRYCDEHGVPHRRCGKLIVATDAAQEARLHDIRARAEANGVDDLVLLTQEEVAALEPAVSATAALLSPSTGIIDSHALMLAFLGDAEAAGTMVAFESPIEEASVIDGGLRLEVGGREPMTLETDLLVNVAGLGAQDLARRIEGLPPETVPPLYLAKGSYFALSGRSPFGRLIYPVPVPGGLGIHSTLDMGGQCRFGPDVEWVEAEDYDVDPARGERFYEAIRRYWPSLADGALLPAYTGIRPKLVPQGVADGDFTVQGPAEHGVPGLVNLYGIESPGLTAALALADEVLLRLREG